MEKNIFGFFHFRWCKGTFVAFQFFINFLFSSEPSAENVMWQRDPQRSPPIFPCLLLSASSSDLNIKAKKALPLTQEIPLVVLLSLPNVWVKYLTFFTLKKPILHDYYWPWWRILGNLLFNLDSPLTFARTAVIFCAVGTNSKSSEETPKAKLMDKNHKKGQ